MKPRRLITGELELEPIPADEGTREREIQEIMKEMGVGRRRAEFVYAFSAGEVGGDCEQVPDEELPAALEQRRRLVEEREKRTEQPKARRRVRAA